MRLVLALWLTVQAFGADPRPKVTHIQAAPGDFALTGAWASQHIAVTATLSDGSARDVTPAAQFKSSKPKVAAVSKAGVVTPVSDGDAEIQIRVSGKKQKLHVTVQGARVKTATFRNEVRPLLTKLECNTAACHGSARGQGGLRLSLFGGDPESDFDALTRADGARRIDRSRPRESLLYLKITGALEHPGKRPNARELDILLTWLTGGGRWAPQPESRIAKIQVYPESRQFRAGETQRVLATAQFSDGRQRDVTGDAAWQSSDPHVATVTADGLVAGVGPGLAAIVVTYQRQSAVVRIAMPQAELKPFPPPAANNRIDELVYTRLRQMGVPPAAPASDAVFLRRVYLDTIGLLPTAAETRAFLAQPDRPGLIDSLLARDEFNDFWSLKWGDLLRIKSEYPVRIWPKAVAVYYQWVHDSLRQNKPYDQFARELITATGSNFRVGPANFVRAVPARDARTLGETAALIFMGARIGCARCHAHPQESWSPDDDIALGAFFARVNYKSTLEWKEEIVYPDYKLNLRHPRTRTIVDPRAPGGDPLKVGAEEDARVRFAAWLTAEDNPWFAKNAVNRIWFWLLGRGIVHEPDDLRPTNPPSNPELLAFLEAELVNHRFDLRHIYRLILNSRTYQRSSDTNEWNRHDLSLFSHYPVKRLTAEQMLDAVSRFTGTSEKFRSMIPEPYSNWPANFRATQITDGNTECNFLDLFGRPPRDTPYESERNNDLTLKQTLYFLNSEQLEVKVSGSPQLKKFLNEPDAEALDDLYLSSLSRLPDAAEKKKLLEYLASKQSVRSQAIQDIAWAILNTKEFEFNH